MLISNQEIIIRILAAALVGMLMGLERHLRNKPVGMRTLTIISVSSAVVSIMSAYGYAEFEGYRTMDPARFMVGVLTGIGFIGAGVIWRDAGVQSIHGITTAANIWATAILGLACGMGHFFLAGVGLIVILAALLVKETQRNFRYQRLKKERARLRNESLRKEGEAEEKTCKNGG